MFTFLWLIVTTVSGYFTGGHFNHNWLGAIIGFVVGFLVWIAIRLGSGDSVGDIFDSIGDLSDAFGSDGFGDSGGFGGGDGGSCD